MQTKLRYVFFIIEDYIRNVDKVLSYHSVSGFDVKRLHTEFIGMRQNIIASKYLSAKLQSELKFIRFPKLKTNLSLAHKSDRYLLTSQLSLSHQDDKQNFKEQLLFFKKGLQEILNKLEVLSKQYQEKN
ncbi:MAG: hypothetical protein HYV28_03680 [Ignavibacteriales bacterium]|nr:hypothetical protein [Ignavibacteriales bacterium]